MILFGVMPETFSGKTMLDAGLGKLLSLPL